MLHLRLKKEGKKLFGLYGGKGGHFEPPVPQDSPGSPNVQRATIENPFLKNATLAALEVFSQDRDGFFLMVEQGDIDWANYANNYKWMIGAILDIEEAVKEAIAFVNRPEDSINPKNASRFLYGRHKYPQILCIQQDYLHAMLQFA